MRTQIRIERTIPLDDDERDEDAWKDEICCLVLLLIMIDWPIRNLIF